MNLPNITAPTINPQIMKQIDRNRELMQTPGIIAEESTAEKVCQRIYAMIQDYSSMLDQTQDVGMMLVNFGQVMTIIVEDIGFSGYNLLYFSGKTPDGKPQYLIQHINQLSFLLTPVSRPEPEKPKNPIGFNATFSN